MYEYVSKKEVNFSRNEIEPAINDVQKYLRNNDILTFQFYLVGSAGKNRNLVTRIKDGNQGFDMDYNIVIQKINKHYDNPKDIKNTLMKAFDKFLPKDFKYSENSSSVFTIKKVDKQSKKILYSFDFAIVRYYDEYIRDSDYDDDYDDPDDEFYSVERQEFIAFDKNDNSYFWKLRPIASDHRYMEQFIKDNGLWNELRNLFLQHKNSQPKEKSRIIYYNTLNQIYEKNTSIKK